VGIGAGTSDESSKTLMLSRSNRKVRYLKYLSAHAYSLLRQRKLKEFLGLLKRQARFQFIILRDRIKSHAEVKALSGVGRDSYARKDAALPDLPDLDSAYIDRRKLRPPSYRPTTLKRAESVPMRANPEAIKRELDEILSSLNVRERR
jgi:hypothetical protein